MYNIYIYISLFSRFKPYIWVDCMSIGHPPTASPNGSPRLSLRQARRKAFQDLLHLTSTKGAAWGPGLGLLNWENHAECHGKMCDHGKVWKIKEKNENIGES